MKSSKWMYIAAFIIIIITFFNSGLFAQISPGRPTEIIVQKWNGSGWGNSDRETYIYDYEHAEYETHTTQNWHSNDNQWVNSYSYSNFFDSDGNMWGTYGHMWNGSGWDPTDKTEYSNYDSNGNYGEKVYSEWNGTEFENKNKWQYNYNNEGNITDYYSYYYYNSNWHNESHYTYMYENGCLNYYTEDSWDGTSYQPKHRYDYTYGEGCNENIPHSIKWIPGGAPTKIVESTWNLGSSKWESYSTTDYQLECDRVWNAISAVTEAGGVGSSYHGALIYTYNENCGPQKSSSYMDNTDIRLTRIEEQEYIDNQWINSERTWISYENLTLSNGIENTSPSQFVLEQNYPNPFNPITNIRYSIINDSNVSIAIYDLLGNQIKVLVNIHLTKGQYTAVWDGTDNAGNKVGDGTYFYQLKTGNFLQTKKMVLLK